MIIISARPILSHEDWGKLYYRHYWTKHSQIVLQTANIIGRAAGIDSTQVFPNDRIFDDYRLGAPTALSMLDGSGAWETFTQDMASYVVESRGRELSEHETVSVFRWETVEDVLKDIIGMITG